MGGVGGVYVVQYQSLLGTNNTFCTRSISRLLNTPPPSHIIKTVGKEKGKSLRGRKSRGEGIAEAGRKVKGLGYNFEVNRRLAPE